MKINQEIKFQPIIITLETLQEAKNFIAIIDYVDAMHDTSGWEPDKLTDQQKIMFTKISNKFTDLIGYR